MANQLADNKFGYLTADVAPTDTTVYTNFDPWVSSGRLLVAVSDTIFEYMAFSSVTNIWPWVYAIAVATNGRLMDTVAVPSTGGTTGLSWNAGTRVELVAMHDQIGQVEIPVLPGQGGTGTSTVFTQGSVVFAGAGGVYSQDNANLFWDDVNNRLGIGTNTPSWALSMGATTGGQIALFDSGSGTGYGLGVQSNVLQIMTYSSSTRVGIGYGTSGAFTETLSVVGGSVGINKTAPTKTLDVVGTGAFTGNVQIGNPSAGVGSITLFNASNSNSVTIQSWATGTTYTITLPTGVAQAWGTFVDVAGNGVLSWIKPATIAPRVNINTTYATAPNADTTDLYIISWLSSWVTIWNITGSPAEWQQLEMRIKDNWTTRALGWGTIYRNSPTYTFPSGTSTWKWMYLILQYNATDTKWDLIWYNNWF